MEHFNKLHILAGITLFLIVVHYTGVDIKKILNDLLNKQSPTETETPKSILKKDGSTGNNTKSVNFKEEFGQGITNACPMTNGPIDNDIICDDDIFNDTELDKLVENDIYYSQKQPANYIKTLPNTQPECDINADTNMQCKKFKLPNQPPILSQPSQMIKNEPDFHYPQHPMFAEETKTTQALETEPTGEEKIIPHDQTLPLKSKDDSEVFPFMDGGKMRSSNFVEL